MKHLVGYSLVVVVALTACNAGSGRNSDVQARDYTMAPLTTQTTPGTTAPANAAGGQLPAAKPSWMLPKTASLPADPVAGGRKNPPHGQPGHVCGTPVGAPLGGGPATSLPAVNTPITPVTLPATSTPVQPQSTAAAPAKNPAHGQPGHRCDLAVGAPLTGAPPATQPAATTATTTQPAAAKTAPGMNPAHGQPGHRCDLAVGAPLNGTAKPAATPVTPASTPEQPVITPFQPTGAAAAPTTSAASGTARLNPPHGQPGHDCSVGVGKPLKQ